MAAKILGIPVVLHEQTVTAGRASKFTSPMANKIALAREESLEFFPKNKSVVIGNPVMKEITEIRPKKELGYPPTIFITGGSRGAQRINEVVAESLIELLSRYIVYHQVGELDYRKVESIRSRLPRMFTSRYHAYSTLTPSEMAGIYKSSEIVIGRAGASTVAEIMVMKRPAVLIPLPISYLDEQTKNAEFAKKWGIAEIIPQKDLTRETLLNKISETVENYSEIMKHVSKKESIDAEASKKLVGILEEFIK